MSIQSNLSAKNKASLRKSILVPQLRGSSDQAWANNEIERALRLMAARVEGLEQQLTESGNSGIIAKAGEPGVVSGRLVSIGADGVAWLCRSEDVSKPCTHIVAGVLQGGQLSCFGLGHWPVQCVPFSNVNANVPLWVSAIPGLATDVEPEDDVALRQRIGTRMSTIDPGSGLCFAVFKPEFLFRGVTSVNGQTGEVELDIADIVGGYGTAGQVLATNATEDGVEWVDQSGGGGEQTMTGTAMETIAEGDLVHCDNDGNMWVARADSQFRYAVGVATVGGGASDTVTIAIGGEANVKVTADSFYDHTNTYYLSETAGTASCAPVAVTDNTKVWQCIGFGVGPAVGGKMPMRLAIDADWIWV